MDLNLRTQTVASNPVWLDTTEGLRFLVGGVTLNAAAVVADGNGDKIVKSGTPIRKNGTKWEPAFGAASAPTAILWETLNLRTGDKHGAALDHGRVKAAALPVVVHADAQTSLRGVGITFRS